MSEVLHSERSLYMAKELSNKNWRLAFSDGVKIRQVNVPAGDQKGVIAAITKAKEKLGLPADATVVSCYEAGRDGFWIHRFLMSHGIINLVVDSASIEVNRRQRRAKTDRLDAEKLVRMLMRYYRDGEKAIWKVARVPSETEEAQRRLHRDRERLVGERTGHVNRIRGLLTLHGIKVKKIQRDYLKHLRDWQGKSLAADYQAEIDRELDRLELVEKQLKALNEIQAERIDEPENEMQVKAQKLARLRGVGPVSAWVLSHEFFGWRQFKNRREVGSLAGLTGTPYDSGDSKRDQGISKAGNWRIRVIMAELAWGWLRHQPHSTLSKWFQERFGQGTKRMRRVGIVALARKLLIALWKYLETGILPEGALLSPV